MSVQQWLQFAQHRAHDVRLCGGGRMQIVGQELFCGNTFEQKRQQRSAVFFCQAREYILKLRDVSCAIIGRQFHADQQHLGLRAFCSFNYVVQIRLGVFDGGAAQPVVRAERHDHDSGAMLLQCPADALLPTRGGFAADAGVHDIKAGMRKAQLLL